jgi:hypothetical protein
MLNYGSRLKLESAGDEASLASCVLAHATAMPPFGDSAQKYQENHTELIQKEAMSLCEFPDIARAFSYLFAATSFLIAIKTRSPFSELTAQLGARATELHLHIPNTYELCGNDNPRDCIKEIAAFSDRYLRSSMGQ